MGEGTTDIAGVVSAFVDSLGQHVRVERVILFGSRARGDASEDSDVDLLVVSPDFGKDVLADFALLNRCAPRLDVDVDALPRTPTQVARPEPDSFLATVLEEGVVVYSGMNNPM